MPHGARPCLGLGGWPGIGSNAGSALNGAAPRVLTSLRASVFSSKKWEQSCLSYRLTVRIKETRILKHSALAWHVARIQ